MLSSKKIVLSIPLWIPLKVKVIKTVDCTYDTYLKHCLNTGTKLP